MNWFSRVRNSITSLSKRSTDKDLWVKCPSCQQMVFAQEYEENAFVCPRCDHHGRIGADERLRQLLVERYVSELQVKQQELEHLEAVREVQLLQRQANGMRREIAQYQQALQELPGQRQAMCHATRAEHLERLDHDDLATQIGQGNRRIGVEPLFDRPVRQRWGARHRALQTPLAGATVVASGRVVPTATRAGFTA